MAYGKIYRASSQPVSERLLALVPLTLVAELVYRVPWSLFSVRRLRGQRHAGPTIHKEREKEWNVRKEGRRDSGQLSHKC